MTSTLKSVAIIGAGVVGVATAYALARRGLDVTVIDGRESAGRGASYANGAQLSYLYTDALANPRLFRDMPALLLGRSEAFRMRLSLDPDYLRWLLAFLRNCTAGRFKRNTLAALELGLESRLQMASLLATHDLDFGYAVRGKMHLYHTETAFAAARRVMGMKNVGPAAQQALTYNEARAIEPALDAAPDRPVGIIYTPDEAVGDSFRFSSNMLELLQARYSVRVIFNATVSEISTASGQALLCTDGQAVKADMAVVCAGADAQQLLRPFGVSIPVMPMKGYSLTAPPGEAAPTVSLTDTTRRLVFTRLDNRIRVAGLADLGWRSAAPDPARLNTLLQHARASLPQAAAFDDASSFWAGLRPMTPNSLPCIGRAGPSLAYNVGHGMLGWTLAMGSGERLARKIAPDFEPVSEGYARHDVKTLAATP